MCFLSSPFLIFQDFKIFCEFSCWLRNIDSSDFVVVKINVDKCLIIIYKHIEYTFFKLGEEQNGNNKN